MLFLKFSAFSAAQPFKDPFGPTSLAVLETFTTEEPAQASLADPDAVAATLARAARDSYRLERVLDEPLTLILATTMATIRTLQQHLRTLDKTIAHVVLALPPDRRTLASIPGLGPA